MTVLILSSHRAGQQSTDRDIIAISERVFTACRNNHHFFKLLPGHCTEKRGSFNVDIIVHQDLQNVGVRRNETNTT